MADSETQPDGQTSDKLGDLDAQLDSLLRRIEDQEPGLVSAPPPAAPPAEAEAEPEPEAEIEAEPAVSAVEAAKAAAAEANPDNPSVPEDVAEQAMLASMGLSPDGSPPAENAPKPSTDADHVADDVIDEQIESVIETSSPEAQATLDALKTALSEESAREEPAASETASKAEAPPADPLAAQLDQLLGAASSPPADRLEGVFEPPDDETVAAASAAAATQNPSSAEDEPPASAEFDGPTPANVSLDELDELIAENADGAVAGEFETVSQVMDGKAETDEEASGSAAESTAALEAASAQAAAKQAQDGALAGDFASPDELLNSSDAAATAADVAQELDEQPERQLQEYSSVAVVEDAAEPASRKTLRASLARMARWEPAARRACAVVNRPVLKLRPEMRDTLGWVAITIAGPGLILFLYGLFF